MDKWFDTLRDLRHEIELALEQPRYELKERMPLLFGVSDTDSDDTAPYEGFILTLENGRRVRVTLEPAE
jgi:hypothetical protein